MNLFLILSKVTRNFVGKPVTIPKFEAAYGNPYEDKHSLPDCIFSP